MKKIFLAAVLVAMSASAFSQGATVLFPAAVNQNGQGLSFAAITFCSLPTTINTAGVCQTPITVFKDQALTQPYSSAILTDGVGIFPPNLNTLTSIWFSPAANLCFTLTTSSMLSPATNPCVPFSVGVQLNGGSLSLNGNITQTQTTAATNVANQSSFLDCMNASYWTGAISATDQWCFQDVLGTGANPTTTFTLTHGGSPGSSGAATFSIPGNVSVGGTLNSKNHGSIRYADQFGGADWCARVQAADTDLGAGAGEIWINQNAGPINTCFTVPTIQAGHKLRWLQGGVYALSNTLIIQGNGTFLQGTGGGMGEFGAYVASGVTLQPTAAFPTGSPTAVLRFFDITHGGMDSINVDCNSVVNCVPVRYHSDNNPPSAQNTFTNFTFHGFHWGFVMGEMSQSLVQTLANCAINANQAGCFQMDSDKIDNFQMYGADTASVGFIVNSANGFQDGVISRGNLQGVNKGVQIVSYNGAGKLDSFNFGNPVGVNPVAIELDTNASYPTMIINMEVEGTGWTNGIHDSSCVGTTPTNVYTANAIFGTAGVNAVVVDGCSQIFSAGNAGGAGSFIAAGTSRVHCIGDCRVWAASGGNSFVDQWYNGNFINNGPITSSPGASLTAFLGRAASFFGPNSGNTLGFGHTNTGFLSTIGGWSTSGLPEFCFYCYHSTTADTFARSSASNLPMQLFVNAAQAPAGALILRTAPAGTLNADIANWANSFEWLNGGGSGPIEQSSDPTGVAGSDICSGNSTSHTLKCNYNNAGALSIPQVIASGTSTFTTTAVTAGTCQTTVTTAATGAATTDAIEVAFASAPVAASDGVLILQKYVTSGNVNFMRCNPTAGSITPTALVLNWRVIR